MSVGINAIAADDSQGSLVPKADNASACFTLPSLRVRTKTPPENGPAPRQAPVGSISGQGQAAYGPRVVFNCEFRPNVVIAAQEGHFPILILINRSLLQSADAAKSINCPRGKT